MATPKTLAVRCTTHAWTPLVCDITWSRCTRCGTLRSPERAFGARRRYIYPTGAQRAERVEGHVYCDKEGDVHTDSLDPFEYGTPEDYCDPQDHHPVFLVPQKATA